MVISAYTRRKEKRKPVTQAFLYLKDCTYKEGSKNIAQDKSVKLSSLKISNAINKLCWHCVKAGITHTNDYRPKDLREKEKSEKSEKGAGLLEKIITATGEPPIRKKAVYYSCKLKELLSGCLKYTACYIVLLFILSHKNRIKHENGSQSKN